MLKLNLSMSLIISPVCSYLNTSHVKVKLISCIFIQVDFLDLNTSHVKVKQPKVGQINKCKKFKYISC